MQALIKKLEKEFGKKISKFEGRDWVKISEYQELSEDFIREYQDKLDWWNISQYQKLSEEFILEYQFYVSCFWRSDYWINISQYQKLSENFIRENEDKVCWKYIFKYQKLSENFRKEFQDYENIMFKKIEFFSEEFLSEVNGFLRGKIDYDKFFKTCKE